jgi:hypothetical protein
VRFFLIAGQGPPPVPVAPTEPLVIELLDSLSVTLDGHLIASKFYADAAVSFFSFLSIKVYYYLILFNSASWCLMTLDEAEDGEIAETGLEYCPPEA